LATTVEQPPPEAAVARPGLLDESGRMAKGRCHVSAQPIRCFAWRTGPAWRMRRPHLCAGVKQRHARRRTRSGRGRRPASHPGGTVGGDLGDRGSEPAPGVRCSARDHVGRDRRTGEHGVREGAIRHRRGTRWRSSHGWHPRRRRPADVRRRTRQYRRRHQSRARPRPAAGHRARGEMAEWSRSSGYANVLRAGHINHP
jgi:hypothetical protein